MEKKVKKSVLVAGIILIAALLLFGPALLAGNKKKAQVKTNQTQVYSVKTVKPQKQTLNAYLDLNGDIASSQQVDVFPDVDGKLITVSVNLGSYVRRGDLVAQVDPSRPGTTYMNSPVYAPISGIVSRTPLAVGATVSQSTSVMAISSGDNLIISARIPERDVAGLALGLKADVSLQAYPSETFSATVNHVSPIIDSSSRTKLINLHFDHDDNRINAGMFARLKLNTRSYPNVLAIPSEAVITEQDGSAFVFAIGSDDAKQEIAVKKEVNCGVTLQGMTEIKSGLDENDEVIVQGQQLLSGGERLQLITDDSK